MWGCRLSHSPTINSLQILWSIQFLLGPPTPLISNQATWARDNNGRGGENDSTNERVCSNFGSQLHHQPRWAAEHHKPNNSNNKATKEKSSPVGTSPSAITEREGGTTNSSETCTSFAHHRAGRTDRTNHHRALGGQRSLPSSWIKPRHYQWIILLSYMLNSALYGNPSLTADIDKPLNFSRLKSHKSPFIQHWPSSLRKYYSLVQFSSSGRVTVTVLYRWRTNLPWFEVCSATWSKCPQQKLMLSRLTHMDYNLTNAVCQLNKQ